MSADFYDPRVRPVPGDPYNNHSHGYRAHLINSGTHPDTLTFDPGVNYVVEQILEREQILQEFERIKTLGVLPNARWKSRDYFHRPTGSQIHQTKLIVDTATVSEHIVVSVHPNQHLVDEGRERLMKAAERMASEAPDSPATKRGIAYLMEIMNRPLTLASLSEPL